jgi:hypothetical protein
MTQHTLRGKVDCYYAFLALYCKVNFQNGLNGPPADLATGGLESGTRNQLAIAVAGAELTARAAMAAINPAWIAEYRQDSDAFGSKAGGSLSGVLSQILANGLELINRSAGLRAIRIDDFIQTMFEVIVDERLLRLAHRTLGGMKLLSDV